MKTLKNLFQDKNGSSVLHIGGPLAFLFLIVMFVLIYISSPDLANKITEALSSLFGSVKGS